MHKIVPGGKPPGASGPIPVRPAFGRPSRNQRPLMSPRDVRGPGGPDVCGDRPPPCRPPSEVTSLATWSRPEPPPVESDPLLYRRRNHRRQQTASPTIRAWMGPAIAKRITGPSASPAVRADVGGVRGDSWTPRQGTWSTITLMRESPLSRQPCDAEVKGPRPPGAQAAAARPTQTPAGGLPQDGRAFWVSPNHGGPAARPRGDGREDHRPVHAPGGPRAPWRRHRAIPDSDRAFRSQTGGGRWSARRRPPLGLPHPSTRGRPYAAARWPTRRARSGITPSRPRKKTARTTPVASVRAHPAQAGAGVSECFPDPGGSPGGEP